MKFKKNDKVMLKKDIRNIDKWCIPEENIELIKNKVVTITEIVERLDGRTVLKIYPNGQEFNWNQDLFELVKEKEMKKVGRPKKEEKGKDYKYLIIGKHNSTGQIFYWNDNGKKFDVGDYAIVENKDDYDLVKIVGEVFTNEKYARLCSGTIVTKKVVKIIPRKEIRND
jgi:hypothetical protein